MRRSRIGAPGSPLRRLPSQCAVCRGWAAQRALRRLRRALRAPTAALPALRDCAWPTGVADLRRLPAPTRRPSTLPSPRCDYAFPWDRLIADFKFHAALDLAGAAGAAPARRHRGARRASAAAAGLLPVPLAPQRLRERGYNQAWELARRVARRARLRGRRAAAAAPARHARTRSRCRPAQRAAQRARRVRASSRAGAPSCAAAHVALVDDVMTSGATAARSRRGAAPRRRGARSQVWVLARTPRARRH